MAFSLEAVGIEIRFPIVEDNQDSTDKTMEETDKTSPTSNGTDKSINKDYNTTINREQSRGTKYH